MKKELGCITKVIGKIQIGKYYIEIAKVTKSFSTYRELANGLNEFIKHNNNEKKIN